MDGWVGLFHFSSAFRQSHGDPHLSRQGTELWWCTLNLDHINNDGQLFGSGID